LPTLPRLQAVVGVRIQQSRRAGTGVELQRAASRLLAAGLKVEWTSGSVSQDGFTYQPGTLIARPVAQARAHVERLAREMGLRVFGARGRVPASAPLFAARVGLYRPWNDAIDEGWTRWLFER
jgi:hypothetical protein